jgi:hypothetical protein
MRLPPLLLALALAAGALLPAEDLPPLSVVPNDTLVLKSGSITGKVVETKPDGTVIFTEIGRTKPIPFARDQYVEVVPSQSAAQAVENRGKVLLQRKDGIGLRQAILWGRKNNAADAALALSLTANQAMPGDTDIGGLAMEMLTEANRAAECEPIASRLLAANPRYEPAYAALAGIYQQAGRTAELAKLTDDFLTKLPSSTTANRIKAQLAEGGDLKAANDAYRNNWELHKDPAAGLGYARTSLRLGNYQQAAKTASALIEANQNVASAAAYAGAAKLALGDLDGAQAFLSQAVSASDQLEPEAKATASYNQGVALYAAGKTAEARKVWAALDSSAAALALGIVDHKPVDAAKVGADKRLQDIVRELNACLALEGRQPDKALTTLDPRNPRHRFLAEVAEVQRSNGSEASLRALAATDTLESQRWQAYGLLLARKWRDAEALLDRLPEDDGYAAVYRVYAAAGQQDLPRAKDLFRKLGQAKGAPADYVSMLAAEYASDNDELLVEEFDWVAGDSLGSGWQVSAPGTNIRVHASGGALLFAGEQTASDDAVTRAWRMVAADRFRSAVAAFDIAGVGQATVGLELLDSQRANGVALGIMADSKLGWRALKGGQWSAWTDLKLPPVGTKPVLRLEVTAGRVFVVPSADQPTQRFALGEASLPTSGFLALGLFGTADVGSAWHVGVERLETQLKPIPRR